MFACLVGSATAASPWVRLEGCTLVENPYNDGDSFHVRHQGREYIFRLYFVDTPETDREFHQRLRDQTDYFGIDSATLIELGRESASAVRALLSRPFTVVTRWQGAQGRSVTPRFYAFVETAEGDLGEILVRRGLARVYGVRVHLPDGRRAQDYRAHLLKLEDEARARRVGAWARSYLGDSGTARPRTDGLEFPIPRPISIYSVELPRRKVGELRRHTLVRILEEYPDGWVRIAVAGGEPLQEVFCLRWDLSLP